MRPGLFDTYDAGVRDRYIGHIESGLNPTIESEGGVVAIRFGACGGSISRAGGGNKRFRRNSYPAALGRRREG